eukprot:XP_001690896.1 predicted protein [Chlamydomonas reinhardtii]
MGNEISTSALDRDPRDWEGVLSEEWRSDRIRELDRLGGLNRPPIARGQSFSAKLQFLAEQVKKQGDVMQEMLVPPPAPKVEAKYTGFMLATEKRAYERMQQEQERQAQIQHILDGAEAAHIGAHLTHRGSPYYRLGHTGIGGRAHHYGGALAAAHRGKRRNRAGNKLDNLGFMIPRVLADDVPRFVEEQRKYAGIKDELEAVKQTMEDMMCRNGSGSSATGALTEEPPWPGSGSPRGSDSGVLAQSANQHVAAGVSPMRMRTTTASGAPSSSLVAPVVPPSGGPPQLGMVASGPARLSTNGLAVRLGLSSMAGSDDSGPASPAATAAAINNHNSPKANGGGGPLHGPLAALMSGLGRRSSTPGGLGLSPPASREGSLTAAVSPLVVPPSPQGPRRPSTLAALPPPPASVTQQMIQSQIDAESNSLKKSGQMLSMFINRANAAWAEAQQWGTVDAPAVSELEAFTYSEQYRIYQADLVRRLRQGTICLQVFAADPWDLIDRFRPGIMPQTDRIQGPTLGARILCQLALAVQHLAGPEAMAVMPVLLHITEEQMEEVVQELWSYRFFGLKRENVMLVASPLHTGYRYNHEYKVFEKEYSGGATAPLGSGYSMLQLTWAGEAFVVGPDGAPEPLDTPALTLMQERKVEWLVARRARDLALLSRDAILDRAGFANGGAGPGHHHPHPPGQVPPPSPGAHPHHGHGSGHGQGHHGISHSSFVSGGASPAPHHTVPDAANAVVELRLAELGTPKMIETTNYLRAIRDGQMTVGLGRYLLHVPSLVQLMPNASALRPKLSLHEELVRVSLDLADLTAAPRARTLAVHARLNPGVLQSADDLEKVIPMLQAQDHDVAFREMLTSNRTEAQGLEFVASQAAGKAGSAQVMVVFVLNNRVSASAVDAAGLVAKPGRDCIHLVTCVSNELQKAEAEEVLKGFQKRLLKSMVDTHCEVLVRGVWGLIDVMDNYVSAVDARMVVMGSQHLTSNDFNYIIGSITLSALKRLHLLDGKRGDRLLLAQVQATRHLTRAQAASVRRALDNFNLLATGHGFNVNRVLSLEGQLDEVLTEAVGEQHIQLLAMALPQGTKTLPPVLISTLRSCRGATLVYKEAIGAAPRTPQGGGGASRAGFGPGSAAASAAATAAANEKAAA